MGKFFPIGIILAGLTVADAGAAAGTYEEAHAAFHNFQSEEYPAALKIFRPLAEQGHAGAQNDLGLMYLSGRGLPENKNEAFFWLHLSADQGHADAQTRLGHAYFNGWGIIKSDHAESTKWYRAAADQGNAEAQYNLGAMCENGFGVPQDFIEAMKWSILAVVAYPASAQESRRLALVNHDRQAEKLTSEQIAEAQKRAREWTPAPFRPSDKDLFKDALMAVQRDAYAPMAARLLAPLVERGYADAQALLGMMYLVGKGVAHNDAKAAELFRLAARQGDVMGQDSLGHLYAEGSGVAKNLPRAFMWRSLAAELDAKYAKQYEKNRAALAAQMSPAQLVEARQLMEKCRASNFKDCD